MKYVVRLDDRLFVVSVIEADGRVAVEVDGRPVQFELEEVSPGRYVLFSDGRAYDLALSLGPDRPGIAIEGESFDVSVEEWRGGRSAAVSAAVSAERSVVKAPMPGRVLRVDVAEGERVDRGQRLAVLEAMKMENDVMAPQPGCVQEVRVAPGDVVERGRTLIVIEKECVARTGDVDRAS